MQDSNDDRNSAITHEDRRKAIPSPLTAWFLGPKAENADLWRKSLDYIFDDYIHWRRNYFPQDPVVITRDRRREHENWTDQLNNKLDSLLNDLKAHFPFYSPRYVAHMLSEQTLPSVVGYFAGMLYNPNNVTSEAAPVTVQLELDVGRMIGEMLGFNPKTCWAHICSGGTIANIEALWAARASAFFPFSIREFCKKNALDFSVKLPNGTTQELRRVDDRQLIALRPNESILMGRKLADFLVSRNWSQEKVANELSIAIATSDYNIANKGLQKVLNGISLSPRVFVSAAAHYSIRKAMNLLGYGEESLCFIDPDPCFRIDVEHLKQEIGKLRGEEYIAGVIGIVGTTEEGAVDPIHQLHFLRQEIASNDNRYFWLHVDAAWGGYACSLFRGQPVTRAAGRSLDAICSEYAKCIDAVEECELKFRSNSIPVGSVEWNNFETFKSFLAIESADSVTVDPHKLGYVPYPAGVVAFRNGAITDLLVQRAQYISEEKGGYRALAEPVGISAIGPYILEGSKPGAVAASCWLAHKTIPLDCSGHGRIIKSTFVNARKLVKYLHHHGHNFQRFHNEIFGNNAKCDVPFSFWPLYEPGTNVVCFLARPMFFSNRVLKPKDTDVRELNALNKALYNRLSIKENEEGITPYSQPFFVSRTTLDHKQYKGSGVERLIRQLGLQMDEYAENELFILRCTIMNPLHDEAYKQRKFDYLFEFVKNLHRETSIILHSERS